MNKLIFQKAYSAILAASSVLLITHSHPDGDGLASVCALAELLDLNKKKFICFCADQPPANLSFLPHIEKFISNKKFLDWDSFNLIIVCDCGSLGKTELIKEIEERQKDQILINFDHHIKLDNKTDVNIADPKAASTTEIIYDFFSTNQLDINQNIANCILTGILTDTANFLYPNTSNKTIKIASEMLQSGAVFPKVSRLSSRNKNVTTMKIWGRAINNLKINYKYKIAFSVLTDIDFPVTGFDDESLNALPGFLSNLNGVKAVMLLKEENGVISGNFRTNKDRINVATLAGTLGGGGHIKASGFTIEGQLVEVDGRWKIV